MKNWLENQLLFVTTLTAC